jgi:hypothetical protein
VKRHQTILLAGLAALVLLSTCEATGEGEPPETYPLTVTIVFEELDYTLGERIALAIYDAPGKVGSSDYLLMTGQDQFFTITHYMNKIPAPTVYLLAFRDDNNNYLIDNGEPYVIGAPTGVDLTTGTGEETLSFDASTNLWP